MYIDYIGVTEVSFEVLTGLVTNLAKKEGGHERKTRCRWFRVLRRKLISKSAMCVRGLQSYFCQYRWYEARLILPNIEQD